MELAISAVASDLVSRLISSVLTKFSSCSPCLEEKVDRLCHLLLRVRTVVEEADARRITNSGMLLQLKMLEDAMYRGYQALDTVRFKEDAGDEVRDSYSSALYFATPLKRFRRSGAGSMNYCNFSDEQAMQRALKKLEAAVANMTEFVVLLGGCERVSRRPYDTYLYMENFMFGRHAEKQHVINVLLDDNPPTRAPAVLPIIGGRLVGKKTLVAHVCGDERVRSHFSSIQHLGGDNFQTIDRGSCMYGRTLVVVEFTSDVSDEDWTKFYSSVTSMSKGSKVIVISRLEKLSRFGTVKPVLVNSLSNEEYSYLFKVISFGSASMDDHPRLASMVQEFPRLIGGSLVSAYAIADVLRKNIRDAVTRAATSTPQMQYMAEQRRVADPMPRAPPVPPVRASPQSAGTVSEQPKETTKARKPRLPHCFRCKTTGHLAEDCTADLYCVICDKKDAHLSTKCPVLKLPRPSASFFGFGTSKLGFFQIPTAELKEAPQQIAPTALVSISGGKLSTTAVQNELKRLIHSDWAWEAIPQGEDSFLVVFPSAEELHKMADVEFRLKGHGVSLSIGEWQHQEDILPAYHLDRVWVHVSGVPQAFRHFLGLWAIGTLVGAPQEINMQCFRRRGIIRINVAMLDASLLPFKTDIVFGLTGYDITFTLEDASFPVSDGLNSPMLDRDTESDGDEETQEERQRQEGQHQSAKRAKNSATNAQAQSGDVPVSHPVQQSLGLIAVTPFAPRPRFIGSTSQDSACSPSVLIVAAGANSRDDQVPASGRCGPTQSPAKLSEQLEFLVATAPSPAILGSEATLSALLPSSCTLRVGVTSSSPTRPGEVAPVASSRACKRSVNSHTSTRLACASTRHVQQANPLQVSAMRFTVPTLNAHAPAYASLAAAAAYASGLRRSARNNAALSPSGLPMADEDSLARAMRRTAVKNLDFPMGGTAAVDSSKLPRSSTPSRNTPDARVSGYGCGGVYAVGASGQGMLHPTRLAVRA